MNQPNGRRTASGSGNASPLRVMGIDPGLSDIGWGVIDWDEDRSRADLVDYGVLRTTPDRSLAERLVAIADGLRALADRTNPAVVAVEQLFFATNVKTAMAVAHGRAACIIGTAAGRRLAEYTPLQIKKALTGHGRANKMQVQMMVRAVLRLEKIPHPDHAADALAVALCHAHSLALDEKIARAGAATTNNAATEPTSQDPNPMKVLLAQRRGGRRRR